MINVKQENLKICNENGFGISEYVDGIKLYDKKQSLVKTFENHISLNDYLKDSWIKFEYDDGAEVFYKINESESTVSFMKKINHDFEPETVTLFFDELEEVFNTIKKLK